MTSNFPYTRLPGTRRGVLLSASLWMGSDHFLLVRNTRFAETYKRFFYRDVQAILVRQSPRFSVPAYWFIACVLFALTAIFEQFLPGWHHSYISLLALAGLLVWLLVESLFLSCTCHVKTAVSSEELTSLFRIRSARQALDLLSTRIEDAQGALGPDLILPGNLQVPQIPAQQAQPEIAQPISPLALGLSLGSFLLLFVDAALTYASGPGVLDRTYQVIGAILIAIEAVVMIAALVNLWAGRPVRGLRNLIVASLVFAGLTYYLGNLGGQFSQAFSQAGQPGAVAFFQSYQVALHWINIAGNIVLGSAGLFQFRRSLGR